MRNVLDYMNFNVIFINSVVDVWLGIGHNKIYSTDEDSERL